MHIDLLAQTELSASAPSAVAPVALIVVAVLIVVGVYAARMIRFAIEPLVEIVRYIVRAGFTVIVSALTIILVLVMAIQGLL